MLGEKKLGKLADLIIKENGPFPFVSHIYVHRSFGDPPLLIPWENVVSLSKEEIAVKISIEDIASYAKEPPSNFIFLKDYILDKKVLDSTDREVEMVYDIRLVMKDNRLFVSDVDLSEHRFLRRVGLGFLANRILPPGEEEAHTVSWAHIQPLENVGSLSGSIKLDVLKEKISQLKPVDAADVLEQMDHQERTHIFNKFDSHRASDVLEEISPNVQRELIASLDENKVVTLLDLMTPGQAADVLSVLPAPDKDSLLEALDKLDRIHSTKVRSILVAHNEAVLNFSTREYMTVKPDDTVLEVQKMYNQLAKGKEVVMYLYVVDEGNKLQGVIDIKELLQAEPTAELKEIMVRHVISLAPSNTLRDASILFSRYNFRAIPVVDDDDKLVGVVTYRDVMGLKHIFFE
jgi:CBS domain-containing protein